MKIMKKLQLPPVYFNLRNLLGLTHSPVLLLFLLVIVNSYSQTTPSNIRIKGYERHNELKWDKLSGADEIVVDIYRSSVNGPTVKVGETKDAISIQFHIGPSSEMIDDQLLDMVQEYTFRYFWDAAHPISGMIYERRGKCPEHDDKYSDEDVPWCQTWDEDGNPIVDGTGKFNKDGHVPYGEWTKPDGTYPQRQGKNVGMDMITLHAIKGTLKTAYENNTNFSDGSSYFVKSDYDDTYTTEFKDLNKEPYDVVTPTVQLYRSFTELWNVVPEGEMNNPVSEIVSWYQKAIHEEVGAPLDADYQYDGYEIWEDETKNPSSKAPGAVTISSGHQNLHLSLEVQSPLEDDKDGQRDIVLSTNELAIGIEKNVKSELINQMESNDSKFDLVLGHSTWNPTYEVHELNFDGKGVLTDNKTFDLDKISPGPALHVFISYRRTPESEPTTNGAIAAFFGNAHSTGLTASAYKLVHHQKPSTGQKVGIGIGTSAGFLLVGALSYAGYKYFQRPSPDVYQNLYREPAQEETGPAGGTSEEPRRNLRRRAGLLKAVMIKKV